MSGATSIEIGTAANQRVSAADLKEQDIQRRGQKAPAAAQRKGKRSKGSDSIHRVDNSHGRSIAQDLRDAHKVSTDVGTERSWRRPYSLPHFEPTPGFVFCYIARHRRRQGDEAGTLMALREGWQFVNPSEVDEEDLPTETFTGRLAKHGEVIGDETTVLMKLPEHMKAQRDAYYNAKRDAATRAVTRKKPGLAEATPQMPLVEDRNEVSTDFARMRARRPARAGAEAEAN